MQDDTLRPMKAKKRSSRHRPDANASTEFDHLDKQPAAIKKEGDFQDMAAQDLLAGIEDLTDEALVRRTLRSILADERNQHASRAQAARTLAEMNQLLGKHQREAMVDNGPVKELSRAAMLEELKQLQA